MTGEANATGPGAAQPLPPAFTREPLPYAPAPAQELLHAPFFPGAPAAAAEAAATQAPPEEWATPEDFGYETVTEPEAFAEPTAEALAGPVPEAAVEPMLEAAEPLTPEPGLGAGAAPTGLPPALELLRAAVVEEEAEPLPLYPPEPAVDYGEPLPAAAHGEPQPAADFGGEIGLPEYLTQEPLPTYAELPPTPPPAPGFEPGYGMGEPAAADPATAALAERLEAFAQQLRERGQEAVGSAFAGDALDAALAGLISGYLAARGR